MNTDLFHLVYIVDRVFSLNYTQLDDMLCIYIDYRQMYIG